MKGRSRLKRRDHRRRMHSCVCEKDWQLVCIDGYPLAWGKLVNRTLKIRKSDIFSLLPVSAVHIRLSRMCTEIDARAGIFFCIGSIFTIAYLCCSSRLAFSMIGRDSSSSSAICSGDLPFLSVVGATLTYHRYNFPALSNRILSIISFALLTERYPSSIFSLRTLHSEKRNARREP